MISKEVADKFVSAIEADFIENLSERTLEEVKHAFEWLTENRELLANLLESLKSHESRSQFVQAWGDGAEAYLPIMLGLFQMLPEIAEKERARMAEKWNKEHPVGISPGRPKKVNDDAHKRRVRDSILDLFGEGTPLSDAQERIAKRNRMSLRSVQRIWKERETLGKTKPESIRELIAAIQKM
jgi:hypothetical protein